MIPGLYYTVTISRPVERVTWEFPESRFFEYGPEDESYCRCFGIGKERIDKYVEKTELRNCIVNIDTKIEKGSLITTLTARTAARGGTISAGDNTPAKLESFCSQKKLPGLELEQFAPGGWSVKSEAWEKWLKEFNKGYEIK